MTQKGIEDRTSRLSRTAVIEVSLSDEQIEAVAERVAERLSEREEGRATLVDRKGLARALHCSPDTLDALRRQPGFPEVRLLDAPRFEIAAVLTWLRERGRK